MIKLSARDRKTIAAFSMALSVICIIFAAVGALLTDIILASTQWILLAVLFAVWGLYMKFELNV